MLSDPWSHLLQELKVILVSDMQDLCKPKSPGAGSGLRGVCLIAMTACCPGVAGGGQADSHWTKLPQEPTQHQPQTLMGLSISGQDWLLTAGKLSALGTVDGAEQKS